MRAASGFRKKTSESVSDVFSLPFRRSVSGRYRILYGTEHFRGICRPVVVCTSRRVINAVPAAFNVASL